MSSGTVVTFELAYNRVLDKLSLIDISNNLGDAKSLITIRPPPPPRDGARGPGRHRSRRRVVRVSVGLEGTDDLIADLDRALELSVSRHSDARRPAARSAGTRGTPGGCRIR